MNPTRALVRDATGRLAAAGVPSPEYDAAELLAHVLGTTRGDLALVTAVNDADASRYAELVARRAAREPLQHLTGVAAFRHVELAVGPGVFVPRPETELRAGWAVDRAREVAGTPVVVDLCSGSGAIALSIADEVPAAEVHAVELSAAACAWAERNLAGSGVTLHQGTLVGALPELSRSVDVVTCNPPYIPHEAFESVAPEARDHDPELALYAADDGLAVIRELEREAARLLRPGGWLGVEHADAQGEAVPAVFAATGRWTQVRDHEDLAGRPRYTTARLAR